MTPQRLPLLDQRAERFRDALVREGCDPDDATQAVADFDRDKTSMSAWARLIDATNVNPTRIYRLMQDYGYMPTADGRGIGARAECDAEMLETLVRAYRTRLEARDTEAARLALQVLVRESRDRIWRLSGWGVRS